VEENYYLIWAPVVKIFHRRIVSIMFATVVLKTVLSIWAHYFSRSVLLQEVLRMLQFEAMAIGGLAAWFVFHRNQPVHSHWLFSKPVQAVLILFLVTRLLAHRTLAAASTLYAAVFDDAVFAPLLLMVLFAWFITNVAVNERTILQLEFPILNYLGDISYGIYMYHALAI
jgi:peptidoglycan/LPS O-acetylase OafA/YrhL